VPPTGRTPGARPDDRLDALAAAWSAARWHAGRAIVLPAGDPPRDACGLPMRIVV
jgi:predicted RNase H-like nuclease